MPIKIPAGEEFAAVFLSTVEPTDEDCNPQDPVRSISNEFVFNTIMTRAQSLVYCVGNPFILYELGKKYKVNCWAEYLHRCIQCGTMHFQIPKDERETAKVESAARELKDKVFPITAIDMATSNDPTSDVDNIVERYMSKIVARKDYSICCKLVQDPQGKIEWRGEEKTQEENVVLCRLKFSSIYEAKAVPLDSSEMSTTLRGKINLRGALQGDVVKVDTIRKCVLFDEETEQAVSKTHFGSSFLCRVSQHSCIQFYPLDKRYPKFANLPTLTRQEREGVVCFDPKSIRSIPKVLNFIPHQVALNMFFVVKFLGWKQRFGYPLGIIIAAIPSKSNILGALLLKIKHNIPLSTPECKVPEPKKSTAKAIFTHAITIDPEGSLDHDDALTCKVTQRGEVETCTVGVHITNVQTFLPKGSGLDELAARRGCTVYNAPDSIASPMLPNAITEKASIVPNREVNAFTLLTVFTINRRGREEINVSDVRIMETKVTSHVELTYAEAQALLFDEQLSQALLTKTKGYNSSKPALPLDKVIKVLWKLAWFLRKQRLREAALAFTVREQDHLLYPEAHYLVEEFMIWANRKVAEKLTREFPNGTILRTQAPPNEDELKVFKESHKSIMPLSAAFKSYVPSDQAVEPLIMLKSVHRALRQHLRDGKVRQAMHCVHFEHYHPQLAALHSLSKFVQSPGEYSCKNAEPAQNQLSHWSLKCEVYTHFTSPLRRYIDVVVQRQLCALLRGEHNMYEAEELKAICVESKAKQKEAQEYERGLTSLALANSLQQCSSEYKSFIIKVDSEKGQISFCFTDMGLQVLHSKIISLQHLQINNFARKEKDAKNGKETELVNYVWKVKLCSMNGNAADLFNESEVMRDVQAHGNEGIQMSIYSSDDSNHLSERKISLAIRPKVTTIPASTWSELQQCTMAGEESIKANTDALLQKIAPDIVGQNPTPDLRIPSPLCIYTLRRPIKAFESMTVQLSASRARAMLEPTIQLLEVGPGLKVCVQHNKDPTHCFVGKLTTNASNDTYSSLAHYIRSWEPLVVAEAAYSSVKESEFLIIRGVQLRWPQLQPHVSSSGESYYKMAVSDGAKEGACLELPSKFMQSSFRFFSMSKGDLACVRFSSSDSSIRYVFHMVIHRVDIDDNNKSRVYLKFVVEETNYISQRVYKAITDGGSCEIQLIQLGLPHR